MTEKEGIPEERRAKSDFLLEYLRAHDAFCPLCKYNLRNLTRPRCPECGREITLSVGLTEPHLRALVLCLVALCLSAGCGVLSLVMLADEGIRYGRWPDLGREWAVAIVVYGTALSIVPAAISIFCHRRFIRLQKPAQYALAVLAWIWDGALFVLFMGIVLRIIR